MNDQSSIDSFSKKTTNTVPKKEPDHYELGIVPEDWKVVDLVEAAKIEMGSSPKSKFYNKNGSGLPFFQGNNEFGRRFPNIEVWCSEPVKVAEQGDILISVRAPVGDLNITKKKSCIGRGLAAISSEKFNREYLFYHLQERNKWLNRISAGSTYDSINSSQLKNLKLRYPPISEQRRIASVLYNVDQAIQKTEEVIEQTQRVKKGLMQDLFTEGYYDYDRFEKHHVLGKYPQNWKVEKLENLGDWGSGGTPSKSNEDYWNGEIPWLSPKDFEKGVRRIGNTKEHITEKGRSGTKIYPKGSIGIVVRSGILAHSMPFVKFETDIAVNQDIKALKHEFDSEYLLFALDAFSEDIRQRCQKRGTTVHSIMTKPLMKYEIPIAPPEEREKIKKVLSSFDMDISNLLNTKKRLQDLKKGLMQDLLTGKIRTKDKDIEVLDEVSEVEKS